MCRTAVLLPLVPDGADRQRCALSSSAASEALRRAEEQLEASVGNALGVTQALRGIFPRLPADCRARWCTLFMRACAFQVRSRLLLPPLLILRLQ